LEVTEDVKPWFDDLLLNRVDSQTKAKSAESLYGEINE
jgi:hypothetical protein